MNKPKLEIIAEIVDILLEIAVNDDKKLIEAQQATGESVYTFRLKQIKELLAEEVGPKIELVEKSY